MFLLVDSLVVWKISCTFAACGEEGLSFCASQRHINKVFANAWV